MSSSSDIEKLFDHFGGDANAYQEIGRENEAHSARTRWPLLVTLDLKQPPIPAIGQRAPAKPQAMANEAASVTGEREDAAAVTRAKAPLFTRSHRRDIPPVAVAATPPAMPRGASRFGAAEVAALTQHVTSTPSPSTTPTQQFTAAPGQQFTPAAVPMPAPVFASRPASLSTSTSASVSTPKTAPTSTPQPASILGKLFARQAESAPPRASAPATEPIPLQSLFDRLRGPAASSAHAAASADAAGHAAPHSWLVNGPRRS